MYQVLFSSRCSKELTAFKKEGKITSEGLLVIKLWVQEMTLFGPEYIKNCGHWNDHALKEKRAGERSSSYSKSGRIIYKLVKNKIVIKVLKITPDHDYK